MRQLRVYFPKVLSMSFVSLLLSMAGVGQAREKQAGLTSRSCTSRTGLYCEMYGSGSPILFLAGLGGSTFSWRYMVAPLAAEHTVFLIDLRGQGKSPKPHDKHYSVLDQRDLIYEFIVEHDLKQLTLVGNSYGGAVSLLVAIKLCSQSPNRLAKLILIDSGGYPDHLPDFLVLLRTPIIGWLAVHLLPPRLQIRIVLKKSYYDQCKITQEQIDTYAKAIAARGGRHALLQLAKQVIPKDIEGWIAKYRTISVPTLILWGEDDHVLRRDVGTRLHAAIPNSTLEYINYAGHIPQEEQPDAVVCRIKAFLTSGGSCPQPPQPPKCNH
ncbi:MAG TPA: alpha/beta hydrolase [Pyrinomonadaceae bacterium]|nr:alpha/beta hydrolase [Pyrinomonadaceae bacterium]